MAKQTGLLKVKGTLDNVTFYKTKDGNLAKMKTSIDGNRIAKDPAFARTRENGEEFGVSARAGKLMRFAVRGFIMDSSDNRLVSRVTQLMSRIKNFDATSIRGKRNVGVGINTPEAQAMLKGFDFNTHALLGSVFFKAYQLDTVTGVITINGLVPLIDIVYPAGATHVSITGGAVNIDFGTGMLSKFVSTNEENLPINAVSTDFVLTPLTAPAAGTGINFFLLKVAFFQEVNGEQYSLKNGAYNAVGIIDLA